MFHRQTRLALVLLIAIFAMFPAAFSQADSDPEVSASPAEKYSVIQSRPDRLIVELPNRLIVVAQELHAAPVVSAQVYCKTGSIYEQEHVGAGLSHFLEHLLAGGTTKNRKEVESNAILGQIGGETNAQTGLDTVRYYIDTTRPYTAQAIDLLSDWMLNSLITQNDYERERSVIQREFEMGEGDPARIFWKLTQQTRYAAHPARHPTIGYIDEYLKISRDEIFNFYKRMYVPNNMIFVVTGDIEKQKVVDQIAELWAGARPHALPSLSFPIEPVISEPKSASGTADIKRPRLRLAWPGTKLAEPGDYALDLLSSVLADGESSRLVQSIRDEKRLMNTIHAYNSSMHWGQGFFGIEGELSATRSAENDNINAAVDACKAAILQQVKLVRDKGVTDAELARAKRQITASHAFSSQTAHALAERLAEDIIATGQPDYMDQYVKAIANITAAEIQAAANKFLIDQRLISLTLLPAPAGTKTPPLARPAQDVDPKSLPREPVDLENSLLVSKIQSATQNSGPSREIVTEKFQRQVLPNGLRLLVARSNLIPAVAMQWYQAGGQLNDSAGNEGLTNAMALMLTKGTTTRSAVEIAQSLEDLGADLSTSCGGNSVFARAICLKQDWKTVLQIMSDTLQHPAFSAEEWARLQPRLLAGIDRQTDSWDGELSKKFRETYFHDHPWQSSALGKREVLTKITAAQLQAVHKQFLSAQDSVLVIVGDIDPAEVIAEAKKLFGEMPKGEARQGTWPKPAATGPMLIQQEWSKKLAAVKIGLGPGVSRENHDFAAIALLTHVLSSFPTGWLDQALRGESTGLVYVVGSHQITGLVPGYVSVLFNADPPQVAEALQKTAAVLNRASMELVDDATLARAKAAVLTEEFMSKQSIEDRAAEAALNELYGLKNDESEQFLKRIESLTAADLKTIALKYLRNPVVVLMTHQPLPEKSLLEAFPNAKSEPEK